jgi:hypothetical protein
MQRGCLAGGYLSQGGSAAEVIEDVRARLKMRPTRRYQGRFMPYSILIWTVFRGRDITTTDVVAEEYQTDEGKMDKVLEQWKR